MKPVFTKHQAQSKERLNRSSEVRDIRDTILADPYLRDFYGYTYASIREELTADFDSSLCLEIGSGAGLIKNWIPNVLTTDVVDSPYIDEVMGAESIPYPDETISNLIVVNALHHFNDLRAFFRQVEEKLTPGGRLVLVEPFWNALSVVIYRLFHPEPFKPLARFWATDKSDPWHSNQALPWIVFRRDRKKFRRDFPKLICIEARPLPSLSYLFSGGVFSRTRIPSQLLLGIAKRERKWRILNRFVALFVLVVIEKKK